MNYEVWRGCYLQRLKIPNSNRASIFDTMRTTLTGYTRTLAIVWLLTTYCPNPRIGCNVFFLMGPNLETWVTHTQPKSTWIPIPGEGQGAHFFFLFSKSFPIPSVWKWWFLHIKYKGVTVGLSTSCSATFWQLLAFRATFCILINFFSFLAISEIMKMP